MKQVRFSLNEAEKLQIQTIATGDLRFERNNSLEKSRILRVTFG